MNYSTYFYRNELQYEECNRECKYEMRAHAGEYRTLSIYPLNTRFRCVENTSYTHRLAFRPGPGSLSSHCQAPRRPSGRNYTVHTHGGCGWSRLLAATKLVDHEVLGGVTHLLARQAMRPCTGTFHSSWSMLLMGLHPPEFPPHCTTQRWLPSEQVTLTAEYQPLDCH